MRVRGLSRQDATEIGRAALERVRQQIPWLTASSYGIGQGSFSALLRMVCTVPPPATPGICAAPSPPR